MTRILIVDDKPENLYMLRVLLAGHGHEVDEARHGAEALAKARQSPPNLVISDLLMPVMDGYTLLRHWKTDEQFRQIPFIVYTATYTEPRDEQLALDLGADAFIVKPTEPEPFMARIQEVLAKQANGVLSVKLPTDGEEVQLRQYNKVLIRRLEIKMDQLQQANRDLERDIAARKKAEEALRQSRASALNMMEDAVAARDRAEQASKALEREVEERRKAEDEVRRLNAELEQRVHDRTAQLEAANKEMEAFSYSVSHDLRAPLRGINGYASILTEDYTQRLDKEGRRLLGTICSEAGRMGQMIDELLAFSRFGRQSMLMEKVDMTALAQSVFDRCAAQASGRNIQLNLHPLPSAQGDAALLSHVWVNLISNAIKYTRTKPVAEIEITGRVDGSGGIVYCVKDNGVGFDMKHVQKLFGVFQRLHNEADFEGTGVGLALVQRIVQRHGGRVWAESTLNVGATFHFALPVSKK